MARATPINHHSFKRSKHSEEDVNSAIESTNIINEKLTRTQKNLDEAKLYVSAAKEYIDSLKNVVEGLRDYLALAEVDVVTAEECVTESIRRIRLLQSEEEVNSSPIPDVPSRNADNDSKRNAAVTRITRSLHELSKTFPDTVKRYVNNPHVTLDACDPIKCEKYYGFPIIVVGPKASEPTCSKFESGGSIYGSSDSLYVVNQTLDCGDLESSDDSMDGAINSNLNQLTNHNGSRIKDHSEAENYLHGDTYKIQNGSGIVDPARINRGKFVYDAVELENLRIRERDMPTDLYEISNARIEYNSSDNDSSCQESPQNPNIEENLMSKRIENSNRIDHSTSINTLSENQQFENLSNIELSMREKSSGFRYRKGENAANEEVFVDLEDYTEDVKPTCTTDSIENTRPAFEKLTKVAEGNDSRQQGMELHLGSSCDGELDISIIQINSHSDEGESFNGSRTQKTKSATSSEDGIINSPDDDDDSYITISEATTSDTSLYDEISDASLLLKSDTTSDGKSTQDSFSDESIAVFETEDKDSSNMSLTDCSGSGIIRLKADSSSISTANSSVNKSHSCPVSDSSQNDLNRSLLRSASNISVNSRLSRVSLNTSYGSFKEGVSSASLNNSRELFDERHGLRMNLKELKSENEKDIDESCLSEQSLNFISSPYPQKQCIKKMAENFESLRNCSGVENCVSKRIENLDTLRESPIIEKPVKSSSLTSFRHLSSGVENQTNSNDVAALFDPLRCPPRTGKQSNSNSAVPNFNHSKSSELEKQSDTNSTTSNCDSLRSSPGIEKQITSNYVTAIVDLLRSSAIEKKVNSDNTSSNMNPSGRSSGIEKQITSNCVTAIFDPLKSSPTIENKVNSDNTSSNLNSSRRSPGIEKQITTNCVTAMFDPLRSSPAMENKVNSDSMSSNMNLSKRSPTIDKPMNSEDSSNLDSSRSTPGIDKQVNLNSTAEDVNLLGSPPATVLLPNSAAVIFEKQINSNSATEILDPLRSSSIIEKQKNVNSATEALISSGIENHVSDSVSACFDPSRDSRGIEKQMNSNCVIAIFDPLRNSLAVENEVNSNNTSDLDPLSSSGIGNK